MKVGDLIWAADIKTLGYEKTLFLVIAKCRSNFIIERLKDGSRLKARPQMDNKLLIKSFFVSYEIVKGGD